MHRMSLQTSASNVRHLCRVELGLSWRLGFSLSRRSLCQIQSVLNPCTASSCVIIRSVLISKLMPVVQALQCDVDKHYKLSYIDGVIVLVTTIT